MKKALNTESITNELRGASVFFPSQKASMDVFEQPSSPLPEVINDDEVTASKKEAIDVQAVMPSSGHAVTQSRRHDGTPPRSHAVMPSQAQEKVLIDRYHKGKKRAVLALQSIGSQKGTMRLSAEERGLLKSAVYNYEANGINISENEIIRIALNYLLEEDEYPDSGSQLDQIIKELKREK